jgi:uncharacterized membrane protein YphA (DoxX/SURF4 family)
MPATFLIDPLPIWIAAAMVATLFAHAALAKMADLSLLEQHLSAYGLPQAILPIATRLLPIIELATAFMLLSPLRTQGAWLAATLLMAYTLVMGYHRWQRHELDCGCGGEPLAVSWALVLRNLVLVLVGLLAACPMGPRILGAADFALVAAAVVLAMLLYASFNQVLRHHTNLHTRQTMGKIA